jgi:hypothetical protein
MNHYYARIDYGGKSRVICRLRAPPEISRGTKGNIIFDIKDLADFKNLFSSLKLPISTTNSAGNTTTKMKAAGDIWLEHSGHLRFNDLVFEPRALERRLAGQAYDPASDDWLNIYKGWNITRYYAAKLHWQLYYRKLRPCVDDERIYVDVKPLIGWYHLEFVDKSNLVDYPTAKIGDIVTVYTALPKSPYALGPPWKYNPFWTDHLPLITDLGNHNFNYFYRHLPEEYKDIDEESLPDDYDERQAFYIDLWFGRKTVPCPEAGISVAPILQWIWHCLARKDVEVYNYIINWLASWRQMTSDAPDTCLVMRSECGTGKTSFVSMLGTLIGSDYYMAANDADDILGYFTEDLSRFLLLFLDEVKISKDEQVRKLKQLLTSESARVRRMQSNATQKKKFFAVIMAGNTHQLLPADPGERRFVFLELPMAVSNCKNYLCKFKLLHYL